MAMKIDKSFVSEIDQFLNSLRQTIPEADSQYQERKKYEVINQDRDYPKVVVNPKTDEFWEKF